MTVQWSTALRNALLDQWEASIGTNPRLRIFSGSPPLNCGVVSDSGTLLAEFVLGSDWAPAASGGIKTISGLPMDTTGLAAGNAAHYRIKDNAGTTCHEQGTVTISGGGGDATIDNPSIAVGQTVTLTAYTKTAPGA